MPLIDLTKKDQPWIWNNSCQNFFNRLKNCFLTKPVLHLPDTSKLFIIATDASKHASGGFYCKWTPMGNDTPALTSLNHSALQNETTTSMIGNFSLSFVALRPGPTTSEGPPSQYKSSLTTRIFCISNNPRNSIEGKPDGCWTLLIKALVSFFEK